MLTDCAACCFFRLVEIRSGHTRRLCQLTGEKRPAAGMSGCQFMPGAWADIDAILRLPKADDYGNFKFPNQVKPVAAYSHNGENVAKIESDIDDFSVNPINHIAAKAERRFTDPVPVRAGGSLDRGICESPLYV